MTDTRLPRSYNQIKDLEYLDSEDLLNIELAAKVLEFDESLDMLFIDKSDLSVRELKIANRVWIRGRKKGVQEAGENLFKQMNNRNGTQACLDYLKQMSGTFNIEVTPSITSGTGFNFNVFPAPPTTVKEDAA